MRDIRDEFGYAATVEDEVVAWSGWRLTLVWLAVLLFGLAVWSGAAWLFARVLL